MKPIKPLPTEPPFLSIWTPTFRRPHGLTRCLASVGSQTLADEIEQIVVPDHSGYGIASGLYLRLPWYASAFRGRYVHILCDDDVYADPKVVAELKAFAEKESYPEVIIGRVVKNGLALPIADPSGPPVAGHVDLASYVVRNDVWQRHVGDYGRRYEGDFDHATVLWNAGYRHAFFNRLVAIGDARNGRPEVDWT